MTAERRSHIEWKWAPYRLVAYWQAFGWHSTEHWQTGDHETTCVHMWKKIVEVWFI